VQTSATEPGASRLTWVKRDAPLNELDDTSQRILAAQPTSGTSIFDPVLCELVYRWFCPPGGSVLDPFAGGSVRGIVASKCGLAYTGIDLSAVQIAANEEQAGRICTGQIGTMPRWIVGDSRNIQTLAPGQYDLVFSCPPYFDLELYSDDPQDLSNAGDYDAFLAAYRKIIAQCCAMLRNNRFGCFVVGDIRDKQGFYRNFPGETVAAFKAAGMMLYNEAILVTAIGSLPIRIGKQFGSYRKLGKTHQNVLIFYKGKPHSIKAEFPANIEFGNP
jgi:DNA modification methylase